MTTKPQRRIPSYRLHKPTGQAVVTLDGRDVYLGRHGTPKSREAFDRLTAQWLANGCTAVYRHQAIRVHQSRLYQRLAQG